MTMEDIPNVAQLMALMYEESVNYHKLSFSWDRVEEVCRQTIEGGFALVYDQGDGVIVGVFGGVVYEPTFSRDIMASDLVFYVHPNHRGYVSIRMIKAFIAWSVGKGCKLISVGVTAGIDNDRVVELYESMGFVRAGNSLMMEV